jgi:hypothetical protein
MGDTDVLAPYNQVYNAQVADLINSTNVLVAGALRVKTSKCRKCVLLANIKQYYDSKISEFQQGYLAGVQNEYLQALQINAEQQAILDNVNTESGPIFDITARAYTSNKKALLIGCNYVGTDNELYGCINDVNFIKSKLEDQYNFIQEDITIMTDESANSFYPTKTNILTAFINLLSSSKSGDTLFVLFSGHGSRTIDISGDEKSGLDDMIMPLDLNGITDDELKNCIQTYLHKDATLFALFDACFSETMLDLKYRYLDTTNNNENTVNVNDAETFGNVIMISGCEDTQTSEDTYIENLPRGAMTWAFLNSLKDPNINTWLELLINVRITLNQSYYTQIPQLSSGKPIDLNSKIWFL